MLNRWPPLVPRDVPSAQPLTEHRPGVWFKPSWLRFFGVTLQTRMVVLNTPEGLLLYSPAPADPGVETLDELARLGTPRWLVAPNEIHNLGLRGFQAVFPSAHTTGCVGHPARVPNVKFDLLLDAEAPPPPWAGDTLRAHVIGGNALLHEIVLLHVPSRTLICADAIEHFVPGDPTWRNPSWPVRWMLTRCGITLGAPCMSPEHNLLCTDPDALRRSLDVLLQWDFDSVVMSHGRILEGPSARSQLERAFIATIEHARRRSRAATKGWALAAQLQSRTR